MLKVSCLTKRHIGEDAIIPFTLMTTGEDIIFSDLELKGCLVLGYEQEKLVVVSRTWNQLGFLEPLDVEVCNEFC